MASFASVASLAEKVLGAGELAAERNGLDGLSTALKSAGFVAGEAAEFADEHPVEAAAAFVAALILTTALAPEIGVITTGISESGIPNLIANTAVRLGASDASAAKVAALAVDYAVPFAINQGASSYLEIGFDGVARSFNELFTSLGGSAKAEAISSTGREIDRSDVSGDAFLVLNQDNAQDNGLLLSLPNASSEQSLNISYSDDSGQGNVPILSLSNDADWSSVNVTGSSAMTTFSDGTSENGFINADGSSSINRYNGPYGTGDLISSTVNYGNGTSEVTVYDRENGASTTTDFSGQGGTGEAGATSVILSGDPASSASAVVSFGSLTIQAPAGRDTDSIYREKTFSTPVRVSFTGGSPYDPYPIEDGTVLISSPGDPNTDGESISVGAGEKDFSVDYYEPFFGSEPGIAEEKIPIYLDYFALGGGHIYPLQNYSFQQYDPNAFIVVDIENMSKGTLADSLVVENYADADPGTPYLLDGPVVIGPGEIKAVRVGFDDSEAGYHAFYPDELEYLTRDSEQEDGAVNPSGEGFAIEVVACFCRGTHIRTPNGDVRVEQLAIGDLVSNHRGHARPIKWIGRRSYAGSVARVNRSVLPIVFKAGSLGCELPYRELLVSPKHAMFLDEVLVPAEHLVNGVSVVVAKAAGPIEYFHLELDSHDIVLAEGAPCETFVDQFGCRNQFQNAEEYDRLYTGMECMPSLLYADRLEKGVVLEGIWQRVAESCGLPVTGQATFGALRGFVERIEGGVLNGWAQNERFPDLPVCLEVLLDGVVVSTVLAERYRTDLAVAGIGAGYHGFRLVLPAASAAVHLERVFVRRAGSGTELPHLPCSEAALESEQRIAA